MCPILIVNTCQCSALDNIAYLDKDLTNNTWNHTRIHTHVVTGHFLASPEAMADVPQDHVAIKWNFVSACLSNFITPTLTRARVHAEGARWDIPAHATTAGAAIRAHRSPGARLEVSAIPRRPWLRPPQISQTAWHKSLAGNWAHVRCTCRVAYKVDALRSGQTALGGTSRGPPQL